MRLQDCACSSSSCCLLLLKQEQYRRELVKCPQCKLLFDFTRLPLGATMTPRGGIVLDDNLMHNYGPVISTMRNQLQY